MQTWNPCPVPTSTVTTSMAPAPTGYTAPNTNPMGYMQYVNQPIPSGYTAEQWAAAQQQNWANYQQWQQQYQQWQAQYGEKYQESIMKQYGQQAPPLPVTSQPPPPPPKDENPPLPPTSMVSSYGYSTTLPPPLSGVKRSSVSEIESDSAKKMKESDDEPSEAEKIFDAQFKQAEEQFNAWKLQNANHPDKDKYNQYVAQYTSWREKQIKRRELKRLKREQQKLAAAAKGTGTSLNLTTKQEQTAPALQVGPAAPMQQSAPTAIPQLSMTPMLQPADMTQAWAQWGQYTQPMATPMTNTIPQYGMPPPMSMTTPAQPNFSQPPPGFPPVNLSQPPPGFSQPPPPVNTNALPPPVSQPPANTKIQPHQGPNYSQRNFNPPQNQQRTPPYSDNNQNKNRFNAAPPVNNNNQGGNFNNIGNRKNDFNSENMTGKQGNMDGNQGNMGDNQGTIDSNQGNKNNFNEGTNSQERLDGSNKGKNFRNSDNKNDNFGNDKFGNRPSTKTKEFNQNDPDFDSRGPHDVENDGPNTGDRGPNNLNNGPNLKNRGPNNFGKDGHNFGNRGPNNFDKDGPNFGNRGPNEFGKDGPNFGNRGRNEFGKDGPNFGNRGPNEFGKDGPNFGNRGPNEFGTDGPNFGNRGPNEFGKDGPNFGNRGPNEFGKDGPNFRNRGPNEFGKDGPNFGNRGPNEFGTDGPNFGNRGPNDFVNDGPNFGNRGPNDFGNDGPNFSMRGPNNFGKDGPNFGNRGPNDFRKDGPIFGNRGSNDFGNDGPNFSMRGPNNFSNDGPNFGNKGPNNFRNDGPNFGNKGPNNFGNDGPNFGNTGPNNFGNDGPNFGNKGPNNFRNDGPNFGNTGPNNFGNDGPNFGNKGPNNFRNDGPNFGKKGKNNFKKDGPNFGNRGSNDFEHDGPNFRNRGPDNFGNRGSNNFEHDGPNFGNRGPDNFGNRGSNNFEHDGPNFGNRGPDNFGNRGSNEFNHDGPNFGNRGPDNFGNRGSNNFNNDGPNNFRNAGLNNCNNRGQNNFGNDGPKNFRNQGPNNFSNDDFNNFGNRGSNNFGSRDFKNVNNDGANFGNRDNFDKVGPTFKNRDTNDFDYQDPNCSGIEDPRKSPNDMSNNIEKKDLNAFENNSPLEFKKGPKNKNKKGKNKNKKDSKTQEFSENINDPGDPKSSNQSDLGMPSSQFGLNLNPISDKMRQDQDDNPDTKETETRLLAEDKKASNANSEPPEPLDKMNMNLQPPEQLEVAIISTLEEPPALSFTDDISLDDTNDFIHPSFTEQRPLQLDEPSINESHFSPFDSENFNNAPPLSEPLETINQSIVDPPSTKKAIPSLLDLKIVPPPKMKIPPKSQLDSNDESTPKSKNEFTAPAKVIDYAHSKKPIVTEFVEPIFAFDYGHGKLRPNVPNLCADFKNWEDNEKNLSEYHEEMKRRSEKIGKIWTSSPPRLVNTLLQKETESLTTDERISAGEKSSSPDNDKEEEEKNKSQNVTDIVPKMSNLAMVRLAYDDLLCSPSQLTEPPKIAIILRGPPGSGKSVVANLIKDKEVIQRASAPRILSIDDYYLVKRDSAANNGKTEEMEYNYVEAMEAECYNHLVKTFKKDVTDGSFNFIILDNINEKISDYEEMWSLAKTNGFKVYVCEMETDAQICLKRNIHNRSEDEINRIIDYFEPTPSHHDKLDVTPLLQELAIEDVKIEDVQEAPKDDFKEKENNSINDDSQDSQEDMKEMGVRKWEKMEAEDKLDRLDGLTRKHEKKPQTKEEFLQVPDNYNVEDGSGKKRVRWADLEKQNQQETTRAVESDVHRTHENQKMPREPKPTFAGNALTRTKYISSRFQSKFNKRRFNNRR